MTKILRAEEAKMRHDKVELLKQHFEVAKDKDIAEFWSLFDQTYGDDSIGQERILILKDFDCFLENQKMGAEDKLVERINAIKGNLESLMVQLGS